MIDPITKNNINFFIINSNSKVSFSINNQNIIDNSIKIKNYYYDILNNRNIKITTFESNYIKDLPIKIIPDKSYAFLKNVNKIDEKMFVIDITYEIISSKSFPGMSTETPSEYSNDLIDTYVNQNGDIIERKNKKFYFRFVSNRVFEAYKKSKKEKKLVNKRNEEIKPVANEIN